MSNFTARLRKTVRFTRTCSKKKYLTLAPEDRREETYRKQIFHPKTGRFVYKDEKYWIRILPPEFNPAIPRLRRLLKRQRVQWTESHEIDQDGVEWLILKASNQTV